MEREQEKIYVVVGKDVQEGLGTLGWALKNWSNKPVSFVILHVSNSSKDFVHTPFGKLPVSSVNDERLELFRAREQEKVDKFLCKYLAFCCKVDAKIMKVEKSEEPIQEIILELISGIPIKKLVVGLTLSKSTSSCDSFYVYVHKPEFCELYIVANGKPVFIREENGEGYYEDEYGVIVASPSKKPRDKRRLRGWLGKMLIDITSPKADHESPTRMPSPSCAGTPEAQHRSEDQAEELDNYIKCLLTSNAMDKEEEHISSLDSIDPTKLDTGDPNMFQSASERTRVLREKIEEAQRMAMAKKIEAKADIERQSKAQWAISLCNQRAEEVEALVLEETTKQVQLKEELDKVREELHQVSRDIIDSKCQLGSLQDLKGDLEMKLDTYSSERSRIEAEIEKAEQARADTLREMDEVRRERDILRRMIDWSTEVKAEGWSNISSHGHREFSVEEVRVATNDFSETTVVWTGAEGAVYRGRLSHLDVAIKFKTAFCLQSPEEFSKQVEILRQIHHPHVMTMMGACMDRRCVVFEYLHSGSLHDVLFSGKHKPKMQASFLPWHVRIRIASEVGSALGFLHSSRPKPTPHGRLDASHVLLDHNLVAKISSPDPTSASSAGSDIASLGILVMQLLTGKEVIIVEDVQRALEEGNLILIMDHAAGNWPLDLAAEFAGIGVRYTIEEIGATNGIEFTAKMLKELEDLKLRAEERRADGGDGGAEDQLDVPSVFLCPIFQEVMKQPHVAADGFSYELEAIKEWFDGGHETSPMTNLKLKHKLLTPNHTLRSLISNWNNAAATPKY